MKPFKFIILCLLSLSTYMAFGSPVLVRRLQEKRKLYQRNVNRVTKLDVFCSLDTEQKIHDYRCELLSKFQQKIRAISQTLSSLGMPLKAQREFWLGLAKDCRGKGLSVLARHYEHFVEYELEQLQKKYDDKAVPSIGVTK